MTDDLLEDADPTFRWPVGVTRPVAVAPAAVWKAISEPGNLEKCHPFCAANPVHEWPGEHSRDEVRYLNGLVFERRFRRWIEGVGYDLDIGRRGGPSSLVAWRIIPDGPGRSFLRITVYPYLLQGVPVLVRWIPHLARVRPMLAAYLSSVTGGFEWYLTRGEPVPRNQFGKHAWFSA